MTLSTALNPVNLLERQAMLALLPRPTASGKALAATLLLIFLAPVLAQVEGSPRALVQTTADRLLTTVRQQRQTLADHPQHLQTIIEEILIPVVDTRRVTRWILGKYWRQASPEQRTRFLRELQTLLIRSYAAPLVEFAEDIKITYRPFRNLPKDEDVVVRTRVHYPGREPVAVNYSLHRRDGRWKVYDVTVAGVSAVVTLRATVAEEIQKLGLEGFINKLTEHNRRTG